ncbi:hypothetical protein Q31b_20200 [Novipirellula aureliae]|uniref:Uncharacterized protein n=1 Tax=Novipirellula aureliae TaxID=2527966 RepID=A0A5C6E662_9BACT|nr:hypothetical protein [Novipirellula aureliae]TWU42986.1 hypothetical protein Q31b_20200 [Novipirellula aureliae]
MHVVHLADLAAIVSQHVPAVTHFAGQLSGASKTDAEEQAVASSVTPYWVSTRSRLELWHQVIARYRRAESQGDRHTMGQWWNRHVSVLEEILVSELLCRIVAAVGHHIDASRGQQNLSPITESVFDCHMEVRSRVHHLMLFGRGSSVRDAVRLNRLRQGVEHWTDAILGRMMPQCRSAVRYAIDADRAIAFAEESDDFGWSVLQTTAAQKTTYWLFNLAMHDMLTRRTSPTPALPRANRRVADSVMGMFPVELFDSFGVAKSLRLRQIESNAVDQETQPVRDPIEVKHHHFPKLRTDHAHPIRSQRRYLSD